MTSTTSEIEKAVKNLGTATLESALSSTGLLDAKKLARKELVEAYQKKVIDTGISTFVKRLKKDEVKKVLELLAIEDTTEKDDADVRFRKFVFKNDIF
jgi:hypothetical protein